MKKAIFTLIILCSVFHLMGQAGNGLQMITEGGNIGWRLFEMKDDNYGNIGSNAVDLSISLFSSPTRGATGSYSIATGYQTTAAGNYSIAMGRSTAALGLSSMANGSFTTAKGNYSTAMGYETTAEGRYSIALGWKTTASGLATTAIGVYNTIDKNADSTNFDLSNRALVIGNGTSSNRSDAMTVLFDGTTTIAGSVTAPSFIGDGSSLTNLPKAGLDKITEGSNTGWRLAGSNSSNYGDIGENAVDLSISDIPSLTIGATGNYSAAIGYYSIASEFASMAMGRATTASGVASTAMGTATTASGGSSTAMGSETTASGTFSTAIGRQILASGFGTTAIGTNNTINNNANPTSFDISNRAFVIGNGTSITNRSDALTVLFDGTTTIAGSVTAPAFVGDGSALENLPVTGLDKITEGSNTGWRLAGNSSNNYGDIGRNSVDLSFSNNQSSTNGATGTNSIAMGISTIASGDLSLAYGAQSLASGDYSTASGLQTIASQNYSMASGIKTRATGSFSSASGRESIASGDFSLASGSESVASGYFSSASGIQTIASGFGTVAIGSNNTTYSKANPTTFDPVNRAFVIGNGPDGSNRSDAFTVYFDGTATLAGDLTVHSDRRLKTNISSLGPTLAKLQLLDGKKYNMKSDKKQGKIGLLAQDVQKVFPELVKVANDESETLSLNYQGLIPVLINAVNEQQEVIDTQDTKLKHQEKRINEHQRQIEELKAMMHEIVKKQE